MKPNALFCERSDELSAVWQLQRGYAENAGTSKQVPREQDKDAK